MANDANESGVQVPIWPRDRKPEDKPLGFVRVSADMEAAIMAGQVTMVPLFKGTRLVAIDMWRISPALTPARGAPTLDTDSHTPTLPHPHTPTP